MTNYRNLQFESTSHISQMRKRTLYHFPLLNSLFSNGWYTYLFMLFHSAVVCWNLFYPFLKHRKGTRTNLTSWMTLVLKIKACTYRTILIDEKVLRILSKVKRAHEFFNASLYQEENASKFWFWSQMSDLYSSSWVR